MKNLVKRFLAIALVIAVVLSFSCLPIVAEEVSESAYKASLRSEGFPECYLDKLWNVHKLHPNWIFKAYNTGLNWDTALSKECVSGSNLVYIEPNSSFSATRLYCDRSYGAYVSKLGFDYDYAVIDGSDANQKGWVDATPMAVAYYMNPYTFIGNDITILQYESLEWNFNTVDEAIPVVESMLNGTFMSKTSNSANGNYIDTNGNIKYRNTSGQTVVLDITYARAICDASKANNINPCYLTSKILGEVGGSGSGSVTGTYSGYQGYYNYLNIGATNSSTGDAVAKGLARAKTEGWTTPVLAIAGGAKFIADGYISVGQNTMYLQKFNVTNKNTYAHQYMGAVNGVVNTTYSTYTGYKNYNILDAVKTFYIPVFSNMPDATATSVTLTGYGNPATGTTKTSATIRNEASLDGTSLGTVAGGTSVTLYSGYRDTRVTYVGVRDSTYYRMMNPIWYNVKSGNTTGYICEDYVETSKALSLNVGATHKLVFSKSSGSTETPRFMSWDTRIATASTDGTITAKSAGSTKIVVYTARGCFDVLNLTVSASSSGGVPTTATSGTYSINNVASFISKIPLGTTVNQLLAGINERNYITITKNGATLSNSAVVTTGCVVSIKNGASVVKSYTTIVTGDVGENNGFGDGSIDIADLIAIRNEILASLNGKSTLSGANYKAADIDGNGRIEIDDLIKVRDHILGRSKIAPVACK